MSGLLTLVRSEPGHYCAFGRDGSFVSVTKKRYKDSYSPWFATWGDLNQQERRFRTLSDVREWLRTHSAGDEY